MSDLKVLFTIREDSIPLESLEREVCKLLPNSVFVTPKLFNIVNLNSYDAVVLGPHVSDLELWNGLDIIRKPKAIMCSDAQSDISFHIYYAKKYGIKNLFMIYPSWIQLYKSYYDANYIPLPWWSDDYYRETRKDINVMYSTSNTPFYPIRYELEMNHKEIVKYSPVVGFGKADNRLAFPEYIRHLNTSCVFIFDGSFWRIGVLKYVEGMCCKTAMITPPSLDFEYLNIKDGFNIKTTDERNVFSTVKQLLKNESELDMLAKNGRETFLKYNTTEIRAKQLVTELEKMCSG